MDLDSIQRTAIGAAYKSAHILRSLRGKLKRIDKKGRIDLVTQADIESEKVIVQTIRNSFPDHSIMAEESGLSEMNAAYKWIIDPLDGTTNYAHQLGFYCVSIGFAIEEEVKVGIVLNPETGELFSAISGQGAFLNHHPIFVSDTQAVSDSLLVTGFPYDFALNIDALTSRFISCLKAAQGIRRLGSAALDLCHVACGRFDAFWEENLKPWDTAAGMLIAKEAGASVTDFSNSPFALEMQEILASNGKIHNEVLLLLELNESL